MANMDKETPWKVDHDEKKEDEENLLPGLDNTLPVRFPVTSGPKYQEPIANDLNDRYGATFPKEK